MTQASLADVLAAQKELSKYLLPSPLVRNNWLSEKYGCDLYLKLENMQPVGSFKIRGASYRISQLTAEEKARGVIAASAGNHAQGVAWGSRQYGVSALIVMPTTAPLVKVQFTKALGAQIQQEGDNYDQAYLAACKLAESTGRVFIHAFEDDAVMAGQGTIALEILEQLPEVDYVVSSVGGGGLLSGLGTVFKAKKPEVKIVGCQSVGAAAMVKSIQAGRAITLESIETFADGIAVKKASEKMRAILSQCVDHWVEVEEDAIAEAVFQLLEKAKILCEGSGAAPLAALENMRSEIRGRKVVLVASGGNMDVNLLSRIIDIGLIRAGRRLRVNVVVSDRPGSLARLTDLIAKQGVNVLQAIHDRNEPFTKIDQTEVALTLETKGPDHSALVIEALKKQVIRLELAH